MGRVVVKTCLSLLFFALASLHWTLTSLEAQEGKGSSSVAISAAHALFGQQCEFCHEPLRGVSEALCVRCHAGPIHTEAQAITPACGSCHTEHQGNAQLTLISNDRCVNCHADVQLKEGAKAQFAKKITDFTKDHPQFAIPVRNGSEVRRLRLDEAGARQSDKAQILFTHERHLKPDLKGPKGVVQLTCKDCHVPDTDGMAMAAINYETHCQECHQLGFDPQFPDRVVPHGDVLYLHSYLVMTFSERRPQKQPAPERSGRLTRPVPSVVPINVSPSVAQRVATAERYLYSVTCNKCHIVEGTRQPLPRIVEPAIPKVWFPYAQFAHRAHRMLECASCHEGVTTSKKTADVLLPGIQVCQECHRTATRGEVSQQQGAPADCVTCHLYHDKTKDVEWNGPFTVKQVLTGGDEQEANPLLVPGKAQP